MKKLALTFALAGLALAACSPKQDSANGTPAPAPVAATTTATAPMADMPMPATPATAAGPIIGVGKVTAIDAKAGTITFDHQPIAALSWPAMTMTFSAADPMILSGLKVGDAVTFEVKSTTEDHVVTKVQKQ